MSDYIKLSKELKQLNRDNLLKLSGYIDALIDTNTVSSGTVNTLVGSEVKQKSIVIAYASQTGNAEEVAKQLKTKIAAVNPNVKCQNIVDLSPKKLVNIDVFIVVLSTHGEGDPPDSAIQFHEQLKSNRVPKLPKLEYAVIALGDKSYEQFCGFGLWVDSRLAELEATRLQDCCECDITYDETVEQWNKLLLEKLSTQKSDVVLNQSAIVPSSKSEYTFTNPLTVEVSQNYNLCTDKADKSVHHIELDIPADKIAYHPGDSLGIIIRNPEDMVDSILNLLGFDANAEVNFKDKVVNLKQHLTLDQELYRLTKRQLNLLVEKYPNLELDDIRNDEEKISKFIFSHDWLSIIGYYKETQSLFDKPQEFIDLLNPQGQRLYSISSSPTVHEDEIHLSVRLREFGDEKRLGLVSGYLSKLKEGDQVSVYLKTNKNFRLPEDKTASIIMIGTGTGIAPFRSFLYELNDQEESPKTWLFFGDQYFRESYLYQTDLLKLIEQKTLSKLTVAFSRDKQRAYIQDKMLENAKEIYQWIEQGSYIYLCGSADQLAPAINSVLQRIIAEQSGCSADTAKQKLQQLMINGIFKRDVY